MPLATKNGAIILKDGKLAENCGCCGGACCDGERCSIKLESECQGTGKTFKGRGTTCSPDPCCPGANFGVGRCDAGLQPAIIYLRFEGTGSVTLNRKFPLEYNRERNDYVVPASLRIGARNGTTGCRFEDGFIGFGCGQFFESPPFGLSGFLGAPTFTGQLVYSDYYPGTTCGCSRFPFDIISTVSKICWLCDPTRQEDFLLSSVGSYLLSHGEVTQSSPKVWLSKNPLP